MEGNRQKCATLLPKQLPPAYNNEGLLRASMSPPPYSFSVLSPTTLPPEIVYNNMDILRTPTPPYQPSVPQLASRKNRVVIGVLVGLLTGAAIIVLTLVVLLTTTQTGKQAQDGVGTYSTAWLNRDKPSGTGDWEDLQSFRNAKIDICKGSTPSDAVCRIGSNGPTFSQDTNLQNVPDVLRVSCTPESGLVCVNADQLYGNQCQDYHIKFICSGGVSTEEFSTRTSTATDRPTSRYISTVSSQGGVEEDGTHSTAWLDRDGPSGTGDWEQLQLFRNANIDICRGSTPSDAVCRIGSNGPTFSQDTNLQNVPDVLRVPCTPEGGLVCVNADQPYGNQCQDYHIKFVCSESVSTEEFSTRTSTTTHRPTSRYISTVSSQGGVEEDGTHSTAWLDLDNPSGTGDWENLWQFRASYSNFF